MPTLSQSIIVNVEANYIETYLKKKGFARTEEEQGQALKYWVDNLLDEGKINIPEFEDFLFDELFWGKRKTIRIYKLDKIKDYKYPVDWEVPLEQLYGIDSINFCNIMGNIVNTDERRKIVAVRSEENSRGELKRIQLLFSEYIEIAKAGSYMSSSAYIPVEIDFERKIMVIKAWNRQHIAHDDEKVENLMTHIKRLMEIEFGVSFQNYLTEHKKVLFCMSKKLIYEAYSHVPTYNQIDDLEEIIKRFVNDTLGGLSLQHVLVDENGNNQLEDGVMKYEAEIRNVIEALSISDYFHEKEFDEIWKMGLEAVVARVKFNDEERVLTSLSGEDTAVPIFCTKTFMTLKQRMEDSEKIETLWITMDRKKGNLNLKYDAMNQEYLEILIRYGIRFNETDMNSALDMYTKYEERLSEQVTEHRQIAIGQ